MIHKGTDEQIKFFNLPFSEFMNDVRTYIFKHLCRMIITKDCNNFEMDDIVRFIYLTNIFSELMNLDYLLLSPPERTNEVMDEFNKSFDYFNKIRKNLEPEIIKFVDEEEKNENKEKSN